MYDNDKFPVDRTSAFLAHSHCQTDGCLCVCVYVKLSIDTSAFEEDFIEGLTLTLTLFFIRTIECESFDTYCIIRFSILCITYSSWQFSMLFPSPLPQTFCVHAYLVHILCACRWKCSGKLNFNEIRFPQLRSTHVA